MEERDTKPLVSVIIPTYKRAYTLKYVLEGLKRQTYRNFEVIVVFKPARDGTEEILERYRENLPLKVIKQNKGYVTNAYNLGISLARGQIVAFLDDDAVPYPDWLEEHVKIHSKYSEVGGASGASISAIIENGEVIRIPKESVYPYRRQFRYYNFPWSRPISSMSSWLIFFGRDGLVHHHPMLDDKNLHGIFPSLLHMGANMSVKKEAIRGLSINEDLVLGFAFEQLLSYQIWRRGYKLLHNTNAKVLHIVHKESTGRFFQSPSRAAHRDAEFVLTFFSLKSQEKGLSWFAYILGVIKLIVGRILRGQDYGFLMSMYRIYGLLSGLVVGCASVISKAFGGNFSIRNSLTRFQKT